MVEQQLQLCKEGSEEEPRKKKPRHDDVTQGYCSMNSKREEVEDEDNEKAKKRKRNEVGKLGSQLQVVVKRRDGDGSNEMEVMKKEMRMEEREGL